MLGTYPCKQVARTSVYNNNSLQYLGGVGVTLGGVTAYGVTSGTDLNLYTPASSIPCGQVTLDPTYEQGASRVIGYGIEIQNTTADIYRQGQTTVYRQNQDASFPDCRTLYAVTGAVPDHVSFCTQIIRSPPLNQADAMLIPGSRQWKAADGAYLVASFVGTTNPPLMVGYQQPLIPTTSVYEDVVIPPGPTANVTNFIMPAVSATATQPPSLQATKISPFHMPGVIFTGLNDQTTFTVQVNLYVETFPTQAEAGILVLATPSAPYDPCALEFFSKSMMEMPVGVPASENGMGDWFAGVIKSITDWATPGLLALGQPGLAALSTAANSVSRSYLTAPSPQNTPEEKATLKARRRKNKAKNRQNNALIQQAVMDRQNAKRSLKMK